MTVDRDFRGRYLGGFRRLFFYGGAFSCFASLSRILLAGLLVFFGVGGCKKGTEATKQEGTGGAGKAEERDVKPEGSVMLSTQGCGKPFTPEVIFSSKSLAGSPPQGFAWSKDGRYAYFLKGSEEDAKVLDLWRFDFEKKESKTLLAAKDILKKGKVELTEEQRAAQERKRVRHHGINSFKLDKAGRGIVLPIAGHLYHYDLRSGEVKSLVDKPGGELNPKPSPDGTMVAFVRGGDLFVLEVETRKETQLTRDGSETLRNGVAEFVASEELDRHEGYWWSPDGKQIAYAQVDESPVDKVLRPQYTKDGLKIVTQRYPKAGSANAKVRLGVLDVSTKRTRWVEMGEEGEFYLARVKWTKKGLAFQTLTRDNKRLTLHLSDPVTGKSRVVLRENSDNYVNVHDDFRDLEGERSESFLWSSEKSGNRQLYIGSWESGELKPISKEPLFIHAVKAVDEEKGFAYCAVPVRRGMELHLYRFSLDGKSPPVRVTKKPGWHQVTMSSKVGAYFDRFSDLSVPPQVRIHDASGKVLDVLDPNPAKELKEYCHTRHEWVVFSAKDSTKLDGLVFYPVGYDETKTYPAVIYTYGGPHGKVAARRWGRMEPWHRYMTQFGVFVFLFDGRGTGYRGKRFEAKIYKGFGRVDVEDVKVAADWLSKRADIDEKRLNLWGWSYGGYLTVMSLLKLDGVFRSGVAVAPLADWGLYDTAYTERYLGHPAKNRQIYKDANPVSFMEKGLEGDLTLIHGMADDNVLLRHTLIMSQKLQEMSVPFEMMLYPGKRHSIKGRSIRRHLLKTIAGALTKNDAKR